MAKEKSKKHKTSSKYKLYKIGGEKVERKNRSCPKCGPGVFMAAHKDRLTCGTCQYSEKVSK